MYLAILYGGRIGYIRAGAKEYVYIDSKFSEEPPSQVRVEICEEIGRIRELLLSK
jgi:hypothetical protein